MGLLQAGRGYNTDALALECEVSRRTIFRDLDVLRQAGVPLVYDEQNQRYHIPGKFFLPPTNFTQDEALSLLVLCSDLGDSGQLPFFEPARSAAMKVACSLPDRLREQLRLDADALSIRLQPTNPMDGQKPVYQQLVDATARRCAVRIYYQSFSEDEEICTQLHPYRIFFSRRSWYVVGRASLYRSTRTFNIGRIRRLEVLDNEYQIPRGFSLQRYLRNAWHMIPERGPDSEVVVRFSRLVAGNVAEVVWHKTQQLKFNEDGTLDFTVKVSGLKEISWWILGYGDQAEVLRPHTLRDILAGHAARLAARYGSPK